MRGGGQRNDDLIKIVGLAGGGHLVRRAGDGDAMDIVAVLGRIVVEKNHGFEAEAAFGQQIRRNGRTHFARADNRHPPQFGRPISARAGGLALAVSAQVNPKGGQREGGKEVIEDDDGRGRRNFGNPGKTGKIVKALKIGEQQPQDTQDSRNPAKGPGNLHHIRQTKIG